MYGEKYQNKIVSSRTWAVAYYYYCFEMKDRDGSEEGEGGDENGFYLPGPCKIIRKVHRQGSRSCS